MPKPVVVALEIAHAQLFGAGGQFTAFLLADLLDLFLIRAAIILDAGFLVGVAFDHGRCVAVEMALEMRFEFVAAVGWRCERSKGGFADIGHRARPKQCHCLHETGDLLGRDGEAKSAQQPPEIEEGPGGVGQGAQASASSTMRPSSGAM